MTESLSIPALLKSEAGQALLADLGPLDRFPGRMAVARAVCAGLGLADARGRLRISSCVAALAALESEGAFPASARGFRQGRDTGAEDAVHAGGGAGRRAAPGGRCPRARGEARRRGSRAPAPGPDACGRPSARRVAARGPAAALPGWLGPRPARRFRLRQPGTAAVRPGRLDRLGRGGAFGGSRPGCRDVAFPDPDGRFLPEPGLEGACAVPAAARGRLPRALRHPAASGRDLRGGRLFRRQPVRGGMDLCRRQRGTRAAGDDRGTGSAKGGVAASPDARLAPRSGCRRRWRRTAAAPAIRPRSRRRP